MRHGQLTREQAINEVGMEAVDKVDRMNCEPTGRLQTDGDTDTEWTSSVMTDRGVITAYYYLSEEEEDTLATHDGDGSCICWKIHGYEVT